MENKVKIIIFDWGRTLHDPETDTLFSGVLETVSDLSKWYSLVLVSLARSDSPEERRKKIQESGIAECFKLILVGGEDKNEMYEKALTELAVMPNEVAIVDDRTLRGIAWGNHRGATTIWLQKGKFADELPTQETGNPPYVIHEIGEIRDLFIRQ